ncbi:hypothetical protein N7466_006029 [Penicillium verhagenii]|uniref:uncharacterized protein n=1 Tax=Penicillium verhagenii TaxID=1562060 RepID=UPI0025458003|nr:uncharacterized protein N7466_006029 [Penicillium verhagenii]KAJ5930536.1 hypothetical protein N7466_006029 [Penicillium verhagenii]
MSSNTKTVAFLGGTVGVGLSALKHTLAAGHQCIALCRTPAKLAALIPLESTPNLKIVQGNAHDLSAVTKCIQADDKGERLVDVIVSTIGSRPKGGISPEDPECCRKGAAIMVEAITNLRSSGATGNPHIVTFSTTGLSNFGRDYPWVFWPIYGWLLKAAHEDKELMENRFIESGQPFTVVRASLLTDGVTNKSVRVGVEDPKTGRESLEIGYFISREDAGKWTAENLVFKEEKKYLNKIVSITT